MLYAGLLKRGSLIASSVYAALPEHWKQFWMYRAFVGEAMALLKGGHTDEAAKDILWDRYVAEFAEGYEESEVFVHKGIGELWQQVVRVVQSVRIVIEEKMNPAENKARKIFSYWFSDA